MQLDRHQKIQEKVNQTIEQAQQAIAAGDQLTAVLLLDQVLSQHPDHPDANYQSALIDLEINGSDAALKKFEKAVTNKPQSESHWIGYIETLMESASLEIVLEALELGQQYALTSNRAQELAAKFLAENHQDNPASNTSEQSQTTPTAHRSVVTQGYQYHTSENYYYPPQKDEFSYKDHGGTEEKLFNLMAATKDHSVYSPELTGHSNDWAMYYHLTPLRANLLRPFASQLANGKTLELGAGCGAVTRFIGELGGEVVALEGSPDRARVIGKRCEDLSNVTVIADLIQNYQTTEKFDIVTLIGVLEYSQVFVDEPDPVQYILNKAKSFLNENGILIIAIENQLGLKYFAGSAEDHVGLPMFGINDSYARNTVVTFGRKELTKQIKQAGFTEVDTYVPLPDYKMPVSVIYPLGFSDKAEEAGFDVGALLAGSNIYDKQKPAVPTFSVESAWKVLGRNGLGQDMANSFLMVARKESKAHNQLEDLVLAAHYSFERPKAFAKETQITMYENTLQTMTRMVGDTQKLVTQQNGWDRAAYHEGTLWSDELLKIINRPNWRYAEFFNWANHWLTSLKNTEPQSADQTLDVLKKFNHLLPVNYVDATPTNYIVKKDGNGVFFDLEWNFGITLPIEFVVFRCLYVTLTRISSCAKPADDVPIMLFELTKKFMQDSGYYLSKDDWDLFIELFNKFQNKAQGVDNPGVVNSATMDIDRAVLPVRALFT